MNTFATTLLIAAASAQQIVTDASTSFLQVQAIVGFNFDLVVVEEDFTVPGVVVGTDTPISDETFIFGLNNSHTIFSQDLGTSLDGTADWTDAAAASDAWLPFTGTTGTTTIKVTNNANIDSVGITALVSDDALTKNILGFGRPDADAATSKTSFIREVYDANKAAGWGQAFSLGKGVSTANVSVNTKNSLLFTESPAEEAVRFNAFCDGSTTYMIPFNGAFIPKTDKEDKVTIETVAKHTEFTGLGDTLEFPAADWTNIGKALGFGEDGKFGDKACADLDLKSDFELDAGQTRITFTWEAYAITGTGSTPYCTFIGQKGTVDNAVIFGEKTLEHLYITFDQTQGIAFDLAKDKDGKAPVGVTISYTLDPVDPVEPVDPVDPDDPNNNDSAVALTSAVAGIFAAAAMFAL